MDPNKRVDSEQNIAASAADKPVTPSLTSRCHTCEFKAPVGRTMRSGFHEMRHTRQAPASFAHGGV